MMSRSSSILAASDRLSISCSFPTRRMGPDRFTNDNASSSALSRATSAAPRSLRGPPVLDRRKKVL